MNEFQGLLAAEVFLLAAATIGGACELFNRRVVAAMAMVCVLIGFTGVVFTRHCHAVYYVAGEHPQETLYHVSECIHAPHGLVSRFATEDEARRTGRIPCRCVRRDGLPFTIVSLTPSIAQKPAEPAQRRR